MLLGVTEIAHRTSAARLPCVRSLRTAVARPPRPTAFPTWPSTPGRRDDRPSAAPLPAVTTNALQLSSSMSTAPNAAAAAATPPRAPRRRACFWPAAPSPADDGGESRLRAGHSCCESPCAGIASVKRVFPACARRRDTDLPRRIWSRFDEHTACGRPTSPR